MASNSEWLARKLLELEQQVQALGRGTRLGHSSLQGGSILALDEDGKALAELGTDGVVHLDGPEPPRPTAPVLEQGVGTIFVRWDGAWDPLDEGDEGEPPTTPIDFDRIEVHATTDPELDVWDEDSLAGTISQREGGVVMIKGWDIDDVVYVRLVCRTLADRVGEASEPAEVVIEGIDLAAIVEELDAANVELGNLDGTMFAANAELDALRIQFKNLDTSIINTDDGTLAEALDDARQALEDLNAGQTQLREDLDAVEGNARGGSNYYRPEPPSGTDHDPDRDLWFDTAEDADGLTAYTPHRWDENTQSWVSVGDERTQAIQDAQDQLEADIDTVRTSVDGKNAITQSIDAPPSQYDGAVGDRWERMSSMGSGGSLISNWRWNGDVWVSTIISDAVLGNVDAAKIGTGYLDADRIEAGSITADKMLIGGSENIIPMSGVDAGAGVAPHEAVGGRTVELLSNAQAGREYANAIWMRGQTDGRVDAWDDSVSFNSGGLSGEVHNGKAFPVKVGQAFRADGYLMRRGSEPHGRVMARMSLVWYDHTGGAIARNSGPEAGGVYTPDSQIFVEAAAPESASYLRVFVQTDRPGDIVLWRARLLEQKSTVLIEDGAIVAEKIAVGAITAESGIIGSLDAGVITVGEMNGARIEADSITAREIAADAIGARAIAADAVEAGKIAADSISGREIIANAIKAEHIVAFTITADELAANSVSTDKLVANSVIADKLAANSVIAEKIDALAVTADKLAANAVTADKIAANAITAGKIDSDAINGMVITGATVRTSATGQRVEMNADGLVQYNAQGQPIVDMTGGTFSTVGSLQTGRPGDRRVIISNEVWNNPGTGIVFVPEGGEVAPAHASRIGTPFRKWLEIAVEEDWTTSGYRSRARFRDNYLELLHCHLEGTVEDGPFSELQLGTVIGQTQDPAQWFLGGGYRKPGTTTTWSAYAGGTDEGVSIVSPEGFAWIRGGGNVQVDAGLGGARMDMQPSRIDTNAPTSIVFTTDSGGYLAVSGDSSGGFMRSTSVYNRTYSSAANVYVTSSGNMGRSTSARRYKVDEQAIDPSAYADALLSIPFKSWLDKGQLEQRAELKQFREDNPYCPTPEHLAEAEDEVRRSVGAVSEDFIDAGLDQFVTFDQYGRPDGLQYDRIGAALIPIIKGLQEKITRLEAANGIGE